jgi:hypothetical protein
MHYRDGYLIGKPGQSMALGIWTIHFDRKGNPYREPSESESQGGGIMKVHIPESQSRQINFLPFGCPGCNLSRWDGHVSDAGPIWIGGLGNDRTVSWTCPVCAARPTTRREESSWKITAAEGQVSLSRGSSQISFKILDCQKCGAWRGLYSKAGLGWGSDVCRCCGFHADWDHS